MKDKAELIENLSSNIQEIKRKRNIVNDIKLELAQKHDILAGDIQEWINSPKEKLQELDIRELYLFTEQVYLKTGDLIINPKSYFTDVEIRESRIYDASIKRPHFDFPITFENATIVGNGAYSIPIDIKMIDMMLNNQLLHYDPELQREMTVITDKKGIRYEPTVIKKNVDEIAEHMINGTLVPTTLVWNAALGSSDSGEELVFDNKTNTLTITENTKVAIVDGFHRHKGLQKVLRQRPDLDFNFVLIITNYSKSMAQQYQYQLAQATPISKNRQTQLKNARYSDGIVTRLMQESDLKDRISQNTQLKTTANQLVSYNVLADSIDSYMNIISKRDGKKVGDFLIEFFDELIGAFPEEFIFNTIEYRNKSLINHNNLFVGYVVLANKMMVNQIPVEKLTDIIKSIDFSKDNSFWKELGILNDKGNIEDTSKARKIIAKYFSELNIEK